MERGTTTIALLALLAGCSTTPQALEESATATSKAYVNNYLEIYQRITTTSRRCLTGHGTNAASIEVEAELHQERNFGEVRFVVIGGLSMNYFVSAKIEKSGNGSRVFVKVNNPLISERLGNMVFRWADGDEKC